MTKIIICGIGGKMGKTILSVLPNFKDIECVGGIDAYANPADFTVSVYAHPSQIDKKADVIIDFSRPEALDGLLEYAKATKTNLVLATTGYTALQDEQIKKASEEIAIFKASNYSLGVNLLVHLCKKAAAFLGEGFDVEVIETHHNKKVDAPSGTAITIAKAIQEEKENSYLTYGRQGTSCKRDKDEIGVHAVRGGTIVGKHEVNFFGEDEVITLTHEAHSKAVFAQGALRASEFIKDKEKGMYSMPDLVACLN